MSDQQTEPLKCTVDWSALSAFDRHVLMGIPVVGPWARARRAVIQALRERSDQCLDEWGSDPRRREIRDLISERLVRHFGWPNQHFIPRDPFRILFWDHTGDLAEAEADLDLEERMGLRGISFIDLASQGKTYGEVVDLILGTLANQE